MFKWIRDTQRGFLRRCNDALVILLRIAPDDILFSGAPFTNMVEFKCQHGYIITHTPEMCGCNYLFIHKHPRLQRMHK